MGTILPNHTPAWAICLLLLGLTPRNAGAQTGTASPAVPIASPEATPYHPYLIPDCSGAEPQVAAVELERGRQLFFEATATSPPDEARLAESLAAFEAQCAAGDSMALERIASVLVTLGQHLAAARTFDRFLVLHPLSTLQGDDLERVKANEGLYYKYVGSLLIHAEVPHGEVRVADGPWQPIGHPPLRLPPGTYPLQIRAPGHPTRRYSVRLSAGDAQTLEATPGKAPGTVRTGDPEDVPTAASTGLTTHAVLFLSAAAAGGVGITGLVWSRNRADAYADAGCTRDPGWAPCRKAATQFDIARGVQIGGLAAAGILMTAGGVLFLLHLAKAPATAALCTPSVSAIPGLHCAGRF